MDTTLHIRIEILEQITRAADYYNVSRSQVIALLMKKVADETVRPCRIGRKVKYQTRRLSGEWRKIHVQFREDAYEYCLDLRKLLKMSVSFILAYAVEKYLEKLMTQKTPDNYRFTSYIIAKEVIDSVKIWKFIWGMPPDL